MTKILFVCLGNICRSPVGEAVMRHKVAQAGLADQIEVASRATSNYNVGKPPYHKTRELLDEKGIDYSGITSEQIKPQDFETFDYIIGMDEQNIANLKAMSPVEYHDKIMTCLSVLPEAGRPDVPDPYYTGEFEYTYELIDQATDKWLEYLGIYE
ncbi:low molecular weight protein-tyrosine-phosphatase [Vagococcus zengguangii]|uniref:protein-tyrosine-phosphatase n=1 Tax=Vagococcus zengguangii TaxID=2571750 RepID=A0A4D7CUJ8_9ENTE|nr:low molecular weight protein-tyrosine-phosphatase [Vagococcus zengguangii]QCI86732.1 low molecular weight phosphotyrosine protein phosphatase [Vagococcus zengguangii]TLG79508.1 low molecular weight phosphotyrosine protein phosphatase [Vagococcus zengguangii]